MISGSSWFASLCAHWVPKSWFWRLGIVIWLVVLWNLSANTTLPSGPSFPFKDKLLHCIYYSGGALCFLFVLYGRRSSLPSFRSLVIPSVLFTAIVGASDEYHQSFTPGRMGNDPWDWLADVSGGVLAAYLVWRVLRYLAAH